MILEFRQAISGGGHAVSGETVGREGSTAVFLPGSAPVVAGEDDRPGRQDRLISASAETWGFVPMRGARAERTFQLPDASGGHVALRFDEDTPNAGARLTQKKGTRWFAALVISAGKPARRYVAGCLARQISPGAHVTGVADLFLSDQD